MSNRSHETKFNGLEHSPSLKNWGEAAELPKVDVAIECGWGRLLFAHTFKSNKNIAKQMREEAKNARDLALYVRDPQVVIAYAPQELFIDPSYTFRLNLLNYKPLKEERGQFSIRFINTDDDIQSINRIYETRSMVPIDPEFLQETYKGKFIKYWVVIDNDTQHVIAVCMGIDHKLAFDDPENGASLWSVAVDPQAKHAGVGLHLVQHVAAFYMQQGRSFLDLSVMHSNVAAIDLYKKLGFVQVPVFCIKNKNSINEKLYTGPDPDDELNPYAMIIINEARRRGIRVDVQDSEGNYFELSSGGTSVVCRESLTELTSSIAMSRCIDKKTTVRLLRHAGLKVPAQHLASKPASNQEFLKQYGAIVVKPSVGEQGAGITVDVRTKNELETAVNYAKKVYRDVLLEEMVKGQDLRIIVINYEVVAAAIRKPPTVIGDGEHTILQLVKKQSRRREKATQGESKIPVDGELRRTVHNAGYVLDDILPKGEELKVRRAANLHVGGTIHDVTDKLHPELEKAAKRAAHIIDIPVTGLDFIVSSPSNPDYVIIEANERPGLANHEPQPTAERFIDLLFPQTVARNL
ncbi:MAG TPA: N-acetylglutaminylglutamine synthetase [Gammaproteobacteria bacterium]|nr:N-acetylglutaminylglutamine synthetase [Gammaproteobacteria bacterium]